VDFLSLDESSCLAGFMALLDSNDDIISDLTRRLLNRDLFDYLDIKDDSTLVEVEASVIAAGYDPRYYMMQDFMSQSLYFPYKEQENAGVWILKEDDLIELSNASTVVKGFVQGEEKEDRKVFFPKGL
jgi:uncharacterized protein